MPELRTHIASLAFAAALGLPALAGAVPIDPDGPTTGWLAIQYPYTTPDWSNDQQGSGINVEADIVGNASNPAFYTAFDDAGTAALTDGMLGFRVRLGTDAGAVGSFGRVAGVGIDGNLDGALDLFVVVDNTGSSLIRLLHAGPGTNTSPATTTISATGQSYAETPSNYAWNPVTVAIDPSATTFDVDADGQTDHFLSFAVSFDDIVTRLGLLGITGVDQDTQFRYVLGTSTNVGSLNQDLGGPSGSTTSTLVWDDPFLGALSNPYAAGAGAPVPEPGTGLSLGLGLLGLAFARRRRSRRLG